MITGFNHVAISVRDIDRAIAFYRDNFDMEQSVPTFPYEGPKYNAIMGLVEARGRMCMMRKGNLQLELFEFTSPRPVEKSPDYPVADHGITHYGFDVDDIEAAYARLTAAGVRFHCPIVTFPPGIKATYGRDMDGNVFELLETSKADA